MVGGASGTCHVSTGICPSTKGPRVRREQENARWRQSAARGPRTKTRAVEAKGKARTIRPKDEETETVGHRACALPFLPHKRPQPSRTIAHEPVPLSPRPPRVRSSALSRALPCSSALSRALPRSLALSRALSRRVHVLVFPAESSPSMRMRISLFPNILLNQPPMVAIPRAPR